MLARAIFARLLSVVLALEPQEGLGEILDEAAVEYALEERVALLFDAGRVGVHFGRHEAEGSSDCV